MKKIRINFLFFLPLLVFTQENDLQLWSSFSINHKIDKSSNIYLKQELRLRENITLISKSYTDIRFKHKFDKKISSSLGFRDIFEWKNEFDKVRAQRYYFDLMVKHKIDRISLSCRNKWQIQGSELVFIKTFRQQLIFHYNIRKTKLDPEFALEYFLRDFSSINKIRYTLGFSYPLSKKIIIDFAYRLQTDIQTYDPNNLYLLLIKLSYKT